MKIVGPPASYKRASNMCLQHRKPIVSWAAQKEVWPASDCPPLPCFAVQERHKWVRLGPEEGCNNGQSFGTSLL